MTPTPDSPPVCDGSAVEDARVLVVGAGIAGLACARALQQAGVAVRVVERGRRPGGRMSGRRLHGRPVDLGAAYFTVPAGGDFDPVVERWVDAGLARPWTDTFAVIDAASGERSSSTGPVRYGAAGGLRSLVSDLADGIDVDLEHEVDEVLGDGTVDGVRYAAVVLALPDPQAARLLGAGSDVGAALDSPAWEPAIAVALGYDSRAWPGELHGAFVNGSPVVTFIADDGDRRGDGAPVLVAHTTAGFAAQHLDDSDSAIAPVTDAVTDLLGLGAPPTWAHAHRWTFARTAAAHPEPYLLRGRTGACGDAWGGRTSVAAAWQSGHALGVRLGEAVTDTEAVTEARTGTAPRS
jgi:predicted NAD/FAD-dependent oxidoreductase